MANYTGKNYGIKKQADMAQRAATFDECVAELSPEAQTYIADLLSWIEEYMLVSGGGTMSAKEILLQTLRFKEVRNIA